MIISPHDSLEGEWLGKKQEGKNNSEAFPQGGYCRVVVVRCHCQVLLSDVVARCCCQMSLSGVFVRCCLLLFVLLFTGLLYNVVVVSWFYNVILKDAVFVSYCYSVAIVVAALSNNSILSWY